MAYREDKKFNKELSDELIYTNNYKKFTELIDIYINSIENKIIISQKNYLDLIEISLK